MPLIDFLLNLSALLLWLSWRSLSFDPLLKASPASLAGALKRAAPPRFRPWHYLTFLAGLLVGRALFYWKIGPAVDWVPNLKLGAISVFFRSDVLVRMALFSLLSFGVTLFVFYLWLLLLSLVNGRASTTDSVQKMISLHLGIVDRWPTQVKLVLPLIATAAAWLAVLPFLTRLDMVQPPLSKIHMLEQAAVLGLCSYLSWRYLLGALLFLSLVATYVYLGPHPVWKFVLLTGRNLVRPLRGVPLQLGKVDFAPVVELALVFGLAFFAEHGLTMLYGSLPL